MALTRLVDTSVLKRRGDPDIRVEIEHRASVGAVSRASIESLALRRYP